MMDPHLIEKYNVAIPRYTSYPPVPFWQTEHVQEKQWTDQLINGYNPQEGLSLYIHLPFCENLCTYCGCNKRITKNHDKEAPYIDAVMAEWDIYRAKFQDLPVIRQIHLGGGTPTFFKASELYRLINYILSTSVTAPDHEFSFEVHPTSTNLDHLMALYDVGFRRISIGVQDVSQEVLKIINRRQTIEQVRLVTEWARLVGYTSVNMDIIYGLPKQTEQHIKDTVNEIIDLKPDRLAFYSYAHVPWKSAGQRAYSEEDLPQGVEKSSLYSLGKVLLEQGGYKAVGMDHFCLPNDDLYIAYQNDQMHRNFMGYTSKYTTCMVGLGASSISDSWTAYVQNEKSVERYQETIAQGRLPLIKAHFLNTEEIFFRKIILDLMCKDRADWSQMTGSLDTDYLHALRQDELVEFTDHSIDVIGNGTSFVRNICAAIDPIYSLRTNQDVPVFSKAI